MKDVIIYEPIIRNILELNRHNIYSTPIAEGSKDSIESIFAENARKMVSVNCKWYDFIVNVLAILTNSDYTERIKYENFDIAINKKFGIRLDATSEMTPFITLWISENFFRKIYDYEQIRLMIRNLERVVPVHIDFHRKIKKNIFLEKNPGIQYFGYTDGKKDLFLPNTVEYKKKEKFYIFNIAKSVFLPNIDKYMRKELGFIPIPVFLFGRLETYFAQHSFISKSKGAANEYSEWSYKGNMLANYELGKKYTRRSDSENYIDISKENVMKTIFNSYDNRYRSKNRKYDGDYSAQLLNEVINLESAVNDKMQTTLFPETIVERIKSNCPESRLLNRITIPNEEFFRLHLTPAPKRKK